MENGKAHGQIVLMISEILHHLKDIPELRSILSEMVDCLNEDFGRQRYFLTGDIVIQSPKINIDAIVGDGTEFWERDENSSAQNQLLEQLRRLFGSGALLRSWLNTYHATLGEAPIDALMHPQGLNAIRMLLER